MDINVKELQSLALKEYASYNKYAIFFQYWKKNHSFWNKLLVFLSKLDPSYRIYTIKTGQKNNASSHKNQNSFISKNSTKFKSVGTGNIVVLYLSKTSNVIHLLNALTSQQQIGAFGSYHASSPLILLNIFEKGVKLSARQVKNISINSSKKVFYVTNLISVSRPIQ